MAGLYNYRTEAAGSPWRLFAEADNRGGARLGYNGNTAPGRLGISLKRSVGAGGSTACALTSILSNTSWGVLATGADGETESPDWTLPTDATRRQGQLEAWAGAGPLTFRAGAGGMAYRSTIPQVQDDKHTDFGADAEAAFELGPLASRTGLQWRGLESSASGSHYRTTPWSALGWENRAASLWLRGGVTDGKAWWNARAALSGSGTVTPWAAISRDATVPTFNDLYWPADAFARGNPDLLPQTSIGAEAGIRFVTGGSTLLSATGFITRTEQLILWLPGEDGIWVPENTAESLSRGIELEASATAGPIRAGGNVTFATAADETPGTAREGMLIPYRPQITGGGHLTLFTEKIEFGLSLSGQGRRFTNRTESESLAPYLLLDASAAFPLGVTRLTAWITNAAGTDYEESGGYHGRPRTFGITIGTGERR